MPESPGVPTDMPGPDKNNPAKALTCIHQRIHWPATNDTPEAENELDRIEIDNFLDTLADITLAVARRRQRVDQ